MSNLEIQVINSRTEPIILFGPEDILEVVELHNDALVIRAMEANYEVARIFVDSRSSVNVLFR